MRSINEKPPNPVDIEEENQKILSMFGDKPPNPDGRRGRKTGKNQAIERSKIFLPA